MSPPKFLPRLTNAAALVVAIVAGLVLLGGALHADWLRGAVFGLRPMATASGATFLLGSLSLLVLHRGQRRRTRLLGAGLALLMLWLGLIGLAAAFTGRPPTFMPQDWIALPPSAPFGTRQPLSNGLPFVMIACGLLALSLGRRAGYTIAIYLGAAAIGFTLLTLTANLIHPDPYAVRMTGPSIVCMLLLGTGLVCTRLVERFRRLLGEEHPVFVLALRLGAIGLGAPLLFYGLMVAWVLPLAPQAHDFVVLICVLLSLLILGSFVFSLSRLDELDLRRSDAESARDKLLAQLQQQTASLELEVAARTRGLNETSRRLQLAVHASNAGIWDWDVTTGREIWDERQLAQYGFQPGEFDCRHDTFLGLVHPDDRDKMLELNRRMIAGGTSYDFTFRVQLRDGTVRHMEGHSIVERDEAGRAVRMVGMNRDVTEAHELRETLRLTEERWRLALSTNHDAVWDWNLAAGTIYRDDRYAEMLGSAPADLAPGVHAWLSHGHPDDAPAVERAMQEHLEGRTPLFEREYRARHAGGAWRWLLVRGKVVERDAHGRPLRMTGTQTDITARRELEEKLRHGEEMSLQLSRLAQIGAWEWDVGTSRLTWSPEMFRLHEVDLGYEPTLPKALQFYPPLAQATLDEAISHAVREGTEIDLELPFTTAQGRQLHVRVRARAQTKDGRTLRLYGAFQDITGRHEAEVVRRKLEAKLFQSQKMETLGTLAGGIAHDFNNLLTGILGYQELTLEMLPENDPSRAYLAASREASLRARELVDQILTFSRQAGSEKVPVNLGQVIDDARRFLRSTLPANIALEVHIEPDCPRAVADSTQIHQVLLNFGSNAAHAMRTTGGRITIGLACAELDHAMAATLGNIAPGRYLRLTFADTGHGMDEETRKRIFDPFFTTKEVGQGTGLGLSVVHGIIEAHRGAIMVESAPGQGATFTLHLPAAEAEPGPPQEEELLAKPGAGEMIAVVDDDDTVCRIVQLTLNNAGYRPVLFDTPSECLEALRREPGQCQLLLTDQTMPVMRGIELAAEVRTFSPGLPVLIMSGYFSRISPEKLAQIGHVSLLPKPFTNGELVRAVALALARQPLPPPP